MVIENVLSSSHNKLVSTRLRLNVCRTLFCKVSDLRPWQRYSHFRFGQNKRLVLARTTWRLLAPLPVFVVVNATFGTDVLTRGNIITIFAIITKTLYNSSKKANTMKTKAFFTAILFAVALSASAQVEFLYTDFGRNVICREKKLFWMDGDSDPCFNIVNYKKVGNKETFNLTPKEKGDGKYSVTITLKGDKATSIVMKGEQTYSSSVTVKTEKEADRDLVTYFRNEAGYPSTPSVAGGGIPSKDNLTPGNAKESAGSVGQTAKKAFGKIKGVFKKKK